MADASQVRDPRCFDRKAAVTRHAPRPRPVLRPDLARRPRVVVLRRDQRRRPRRAGDRLVRRPPVRPLVRRGDAPSPQGPREVPGPEGPGPLGDRPELVSRRQDDGLCPERPPGRGLPPPGRPVRRRGRDQPGRARRPGLSVDGRHALRRGQADPRRASVPARRRDRAVRARPRDARRPPQLDPGRGRLPGRGPGRHRRATRWTSPAEDTTTTTPGRRICRSP